MRESVHGFAHLRDPVYGVAILVVLEHDGPEACVDLISLPDVEERKDVAIVGRHFDGLPIAVWERQVHRGGELRIQFFWCGHGIRINRLVWNHSVIVWGYSIVIWDYGIVISVVARDHDVVRVLIQVSWRAKDWTINFGDHKLKVFWRFESCWGRVAPSIKDKVVLKISDLVSVPLGTFWHADAIITGHVERHRHVLDVCQVVLF